MIIAIDGPAASGKSTTAKAVAERLGFVYLDTGAMYRAVTLAALRAGVDLTETGGPLEKLLGTLTIAFKAVEGGNRIFLGNEDVTQSIRGLEVSRNVSAVSELPLVRERMVALQREFAGRANSVVEGRDIGTVVFPDADFKFFLTADYETRAVRRMKDLAELGIGQSMDEVVEELKRRDERDSSRSHSPLAKAEDAIDVDTTALTVDQQVEFIINYVKQHLRKGSRNSK